MLIKKPADIPSSDITDEQVYRNRRAFMKGAVGTAFGAAGLLGAARGALAQFRDGDAKPSQFSATETKNSWDEITSFNNFYEFSTDKEEPAKLAARFKPRPWSIKVGGQMRGKDVNFQLEDILRFPQEERIYRLRCVEGWSMVIPWVGFPLSMLLNKFEPNSKAKYVYFETAYRPGEMPGQMSPVPNFAETESSNSSSRRGGSSSGADAESQMEANGLDWPYTEGLRMDEAMHPLTILAVGLYGKPLPNQNGAPVRLIVPWKYGFKSIKSIASIRFVDHQPQTTWNAAAKELFGFWANVNPEVPRPQSQRTERRIGKFFRQQTLPFNGYGDQVASLYRGMDLKSNY